MNLTTSDITNLLGAISIVSAGVLYVMRWLRKFLTTFIRSELDRQLAPIKAELHPNHGSSLRDKVDKLAEDSEAQAQKLTDLRALVDPSLPNPPPPPGSAPTRRRRIR